MKRGSFFKVKAFIAGLLLLLFPAMIHAQAEQTKQGPPPIGQPLIREGTLAVKLVPALGLGTTDDQTEAETILGQAGITPRNGWIADYPVTPDIIGELQKSISDAVDAKKISVGKEEAIKKLNDLNTGLGMEVKPYTNGETYEGTPPSAENYPEPTVINNYYYNQGPPVVTYYAPPPDYYYLYSWVPYPFWWTGFWFPGFFILNDFHRTIIVDRRVAFISNHFNDVRGHRVFRIDPVSRFRGRTFAGIGVTRTRGFISTGVPRSDRRIFNGPRARTIPGSRMTTPSYRGSRMAAPPSRGTRMISPAPRGGRMTGPSPQGGRMISPPSRGGGTASPPSRGGGGGIQRGQRR